MNTNFVQHCAPPSCGVLSPGDSGLSTILTTLLIAGILLVSFGFCSYFAFAINKFLSFSKIKKSKKNSKLRKQVKKLTKEVQDNHHNVQARLCEVQLDANSAFDQCRQVRKNVDELGCVVGRDRAYSRQAFGSISQEFGRRQMEDFKFKNYVYASLRQPDTVNVTVELSEQFTDHSASERKVKRTESIPVKRPIPLNRRQKPTTDKRVPNHRSRTPPATRSPSPKEDYPLVQESREVITDLLNNKDDESEKGQE